MVDSQSVSTETTGSTEMRTLLSTIMADCEASVAALRSLSFAPTLRYPQTEQGMAAWSEDRENAIRQTRNFISLLSSGGANVDVQEVSQDATYCARSLQNWNVLSDALRSNMHSLRNTLVNYRNADGLKAMYEARCDSALSAIKNVIDDVKRASGITQYSYDLSRSDSLREAETFRAGNQPKLLASQIESWMERVRAEAARAPVTAVDAPAERPAEPAATEAVASTRSGIRGVLRSLFRRG